MKEDINYLLYDEVIDVIAQLEAEFPQIVSVSSIGLSYEKREIPILQIGLRNQSTTNILLTGAHHARELTSIQMSFAVILKILHGYVHNDSETIFLLDNHIIYSVPVINVDGFYYI